MLTVIGVLALAPAAFAQSTGTGYAGQGGGVAGQVGSGGGNGNNNGTNGTSGNGSGPAATNANATNSNGVLAFTGLDLALIVGGGFLLLAGGVVLSRVVARNPG